VEGLVTVLQGQGEAVIDKASRSSGVDQRLIICRIRGCRKDNVVHLGSDLHGRQVVYHLRILRAIQIKIPELLARTVIEVDVDQRVVVGRTERLDSIAEHKELIRRLGIPRLKHMRKEPKTEVHREPRTAKYQERGPQLALVSGVQG